MRPEGNETAGSFKLAMAVAKSCRRGRPQEGFLVRIECSGEVQAGGRVGASCGWRVVDSAFDRGSRAGRGRRPERSKVENGRGFAQRLEAMARRTRSPRVRLAGQAVVVGKEVGLQEFGTRAESRRGYALATIFMLRCAELVAVRWSHVAVDVLKEDRLAENTNLEDRSERMGREADVGLLRPAEVCLVVRLEGLERTCGKSLLEFRLCLCGQVQWLQLHALHGGGLEKLLEGGLDGSLGKEIWCHDVRPSRAADPRGCVLG